MCEELQKIYNEGQIQGEIKTKKQIAKAMLEKGMPAIFITDILKEKEETIKEWLSEKE